MWQYVQAQTGTPQVKNWTSKEISTLLTFRALALRQSENKCTYGWKSSLTIDCRVVKCVQSCDRERESKEYVKKTMHLLLIKCKPARTRRIAIDELNLTYKLTSRQNRINLWRSISIPVKINLTRCETKYFNSSKNKQNEIWQNFRKQAGESNIEWWLMLKILSIEPSKKRT